MKRVYFLRRADGSGPIKIGCSDSPEARRKQISSDLKEPLVVLAEAPGGFRDEGRLHRQFAAHRSDGEWFEPAPAILEAIAHVAKRGQLPPTPEEDREVVFARRYLAGETLEQIAADHEITRERVRQILRAAGVPSLGWRTQHQKCSKARAQAGLVAELARAGKSVPEIAAEIGDGRQNVRTCLARNGLKAKRAKKPIRAATIARAEEVARAYQAGVKVAEIRSRFCRSLPEIYRLLRVAGLEPSRGRPAKIDRGEALAAYRAGMTQREIARRFGCTHNSVSKLIARHGGYSREEVEARRIAAVRAANARRRIAA